MPLGGFIYVLDVGYTYCMRVMRQSEIIRNPISLPGQIADMGCLNRRLNEPCQKGVAKGEANALQAIDPPRPRTSTPPECHQPAALRN